MQKNKKTGFHFSWSFLRAICVFPHDSRTFFSFSEAGGLYRFSFGLNAHPHTHNLLKIICHGGCYIVVLFVSTGDRLVKIFFACSSLCSVKFLFFFWGGVWCEKKRQKTGYQLVTKFQKSFAYGAKTLETGLVNASLSPEKKSFGSHGRK